jgi:membrane fusion protein (multidrug efflux system)
MRRHQVIGTLTALLALVACGRQQQPPKFPPAAVGFIVLKEQPVELVTDLPGRTSAYQVAEVRPQVSGILLKRLFEEGSLVKEGQVLYQINPAPYQAVYDNAEATRINAKGRAARFRALLAQGTAVSAQASDDAQATWQAAEASANAARINLEFTRITAPITGRISASNITVGALVSANQANALTVITTLDPIFVDVGQASAELLALRQQIMKGQVDKKAAVDVTLKLDDGSIYAHKGKLEMTDILVDPSTGSVRLRAIFPNPEGLLLPGLYVRATVQQGVDPHGILVPQRAVGHDQKGQPTVLLVDEKNTARLRIIRTGRAINGDWQVLEGLKAGDKVIVEGIQKAIPDMPVMPHPAGAAPAQPGAAPAQAH